MQYMGRFSKTEKLTPGSESSIMTDTDLQIKMFVYVLG